MQSHLWPQCGLHVRVTEMLIGWESLIQKTSHVALPRFPAIYPPEGDRTHGSWDTETKQRFFALHLKTWPTLTPTSSHNTSTDVYLYKVSQCATNVDNRMSDILPGMQHSTFLLQTWLSSLHVNLFVKHFFIPTPHMGLCHLPQKYTPEPRPVIVITLFKC